MFLCRPENWETLLCCLELKKVGSSRHRIKSKVMKQMKQSLVYLRFLKNGIVFDLLNLQNFFLNIKFDEIYDFDRSKKLIKSFLDRIKINEPSNIEFTFLEFCLELQLSLTQKTIG